MSLCLNPDCKKPNNPNDAKFCLSCGSKLLVGDRYRSLKLIGRGCFGRTFLAVDEYKPSKPRCVIKQFFPQAQGTDNAEKAERLFEQEAIRLEELGTHPQIPDLLAHLTQDKRQYLVQEFIDGQNLAEELEADGCFDEDQIIRLLQDLLPVLQFIHENNVIHRDIKPQNIIRRHSDKKLFLVDFGAAKFATGTALARTGTVIGTAGYVAPEQAYGKATFASDLYSLGVTCIYLFTQIDPFELYSVSEGTWVWQDYLSNPVSQELGRILDKMLEGATRRRYSTAVDVIKDLNLPLGTSATAIRPSTASSSPPDLSIPPITKSLLTPQTQNWTCVQTLTGHKEWFAGVTSIAFSPDAQLLVSGSEDRTIRIWKLSTGHEIHILTEHSNWINSVAISPDGQFLASCSEDKTIKIWELKTGLELRTLSGYSEKIRTVTFSPDGQMLASGIDDKTIKLLNPNTGEEIRTMSGTNYFEAVRFSPDGKTLISGDWDSKVTLWNPDTGEVIRKLIGHSHTIRAVSFSPDGQFFASGSCDKTIRVWRLATGELVHLLKGHSGWFASVNSVAFSPDGQTLASGSDDETIKLWNLDTGQEITTLTGHTRGVSSVAFSPDGQTLASGSWDKTVKIWRCE